MSFLTDTDVNKRTQNLFVAFENTPTVQQASMRKRATPQFLANYQALVPGATFDASPMDPATLGPWVSLSNGNRDVSGSASIAGQQSCVLSTTPIPVNSGICWEIEVLNGPSPGIEQGPRLFAYYQGAFPMPPYNSSNIQGGQNGQGVTAGFTVSFPDTTGFSLLDCAVTPGPPIIPAIAAGDILGFVMDNAGTQMLFFRNGALVSGGPLPLDPSTTAMIPMIGLITAVI